MEICDPYAIGISSAVSGLLLKKSIDLRKKLEVFELGMYVGILYIIIQIVYPIYAVGLLECQVKYRIKLLVNIYVEVSLAWRNFIFQNLQAQALLKMTHTHNCIVLLG